MLKQATEEPRGNHLSLYYKNGKISFWTGDLSNAEPPEFEVVKYSDAFPKPERAFPYNMGTLRTSLRTYGPAVRYPIVHLEMIRMHKRSIDLDEANVPPMEGMSEFVASSYPEEVRDAMRAAIRVVQTSEVTRDTFTEKVEQLAMSVAVMYQEPKLRKILEETDPQMVETLIDEISGDIEPTKVVTTDEDLSDEPFVEVLKTLSPPSSPRKKVMFVEDGTEDQTEDQTEDVTTRVMQLNM